ncbi:hypothetical protein GAN17_20570 [Mycobacterium kubicae]|nr:hypothetical protein [Mycobacterium kubicae]QNI08382.1 hypothetical protein GAN17_20570 [Mycobacterium kubicae]
MKPLLWPTTVIGALTIIITAGCRTESHANPIQFPDMSSYAAVNVEDYTIALPNPRREPLNEVFFLTPDGITCKFSNPPAAGCTGNNFPGIPPAPSDPAAGKPGANSIMTDGGLSTTNAIYAVDNTVQGHPIKTLPPFHSLTVSGVVCGVDDAGTTACKDPQGRAFVLSPKGSGWLQL